MVDHRNCVIQDISLKEEATGRYWDECDGWWMSSLCPPDFRTCYIQPMTRSELISRLAAQNQTLSSKDAEVSVSVILDSLAAALSCGDRIEIRGFGSFMLGYRPPRTGRNPKANVQVAVPAKYTPRFRAGKDLRQRVDQAVHAADHASGGDGDA